MTRTKDNFLWQLAFLLVVILFSACTGRPDGVLSDNDMTNVLVDLHKMEGVLIEKGMNFSSSFPERDLYYYSVLAKHNVTKAEFDSSLVWYTKNPHRFEKVYEKVEVELAKHQALIKTNFYHPIDSAALNIVRVDLWNKATKVLFTKDSARTHFDFEIKNASLLYGDVYELKFLQRISPVDSCGNQRIKLKINYVNNQSDSLCQTAHHDSILRKYTFRLKANRKLKIVSITGSLLGSDKYKGKMSVRMDSISLKRIFDKTKQDYFRNEVKNFAKAPAK